ncbi:MAG: hypothetical protein AB1403_26210, partial [Candidatus Riflebacteria bacterium]
TTNQVQYSVVGQKAVFQQYLASKRYMNNTSIMVEDYSALLGKLNQITHLNNFWNKDKKIGNEFIWHQIATSSGGQMDNSMDSAKRIASFFSMLIASTIDPEACKQLKRKRNLSLSEIEKYFRELELCFFPDPFVTAIAKRMKEEDPTIDLRSEKARIKQDEFPNFFKGKMKLILPGD